MTQDEEAWNSSGMNPRQREHGGKHYRRLLHILTANAKYVKMLRVWLKRSNSSSGALRRQNGVDYFDIRPLSSPSPIYRNSNNVLKMQAFLFHSFCSKHPIGKGHHQIVRETGGSVRICMAKYQNHYSFVEEFYLLLFKLHGEGIQRDTFLGT